jgi:hypothetical protein
MVNSYDRTRNSPRNTRNSGIPGRQGIRRPGIPSFFRVIPCHSACHCLVFFVSCHSKGVKIHATAPKGVKGPNPSQEVMSGTHPATLRPAQGDRGVPGENSAFSLRQRVLVGQGRKKPIWSPSLDKSDPMRGARFSTLPSGHGRAQCRTHPSSRKTLPWNPSL